MPPTHDVRPCLLVPLWDVKALMVRRSGKPPPNVAGGCVGALWGMGVSADAQAYFGTRLGMAPGRRHDVVGGSGRWVAAAQSL